MNPFTASIEQLEATRPDLASAHMHVGLTRYWTASFGWPESVWDGTRLNAATYRTQAVTVADDLRMIRNLIALFGEGALVRKLLESPYVGHEEIVYNAPDLRAALQTVIMAINSMNPPLNVRLGREDDLVEIVIAVDAALGAFRGFMETLAALFLLRVVNAYSRFNPQTGDEPKIPEVRLARVDPLLLEEVGAMVPASVRYGAARTSIRLDAAALTQANPGFWPSKWQKLLVELDEGAKSNDYLEEDLESAITTFLLDWLERRGRLPQMSEIAAARGISVRSLARKLADHGISLRDLSSRALIKVACERLTKTDRPVAEIGASLGYSEPSSFVRAFRHGSGMTPGKWRSLPRGGEIRM